MFVFVLFSVFFADEIQCDSLLVVVVVFVVLGAGYLDTESSSDFPHRISRKLFSRI